MREHVRATNAGEWEGLLMPVLYSFDDCLLEKQSKLVRCRSGSHDYGPQDQGPNRSAVLPTACVRAQVCYEGDVRGRQRAKSSDRLLRCLLVTPPFSYRRPGQRACKQMVKGRGCVLSPAHPLSASRGGRVVLFEAEQEQGPHLQGG